jgi:hypothetical protein
MYLVITPAANTMVNPINVIIKSFVKKCFQGYPIQIPFLPVQLFLMCMHKQHNMADEKRPNGYSEANDQTTEMNSMTECQNILYRKDYTEQFKVGDKRGHYPITGGMMWMK